MRKDLTIVLILGAATFSARANAYLDPATGGYALQMLIAAVLGGAFTVKTYWTTLKGKFFSRGR